MTRPIKTVKTTYRGITYETRVDRVPPKKPKRKMIRVWYFQGDVGLHVSFQHREMCDLRELLAWGKHNPGPIESALIPAPRRKGE